MQLNVTQGDVVVVQVVLSPQGVGGECCGRATLHSVLSSLTSSGMTFQQRNAYTKNPGSGDGSFVWEDYAIAPVTETATINAQVNESAPWSMLGYGVLGANTTKPFDTNRALPHGEFNDCNLVDGCSISFSTTNPNTFVIFGIGSQGNPAMVPPSGFSLIQDVNVNSWLGNAVSYRTYSSPQTNAVTGNWVLSGGGESAFWFVDAIQAATSSSPTTATTTSTTTSTSSVSTSIIATSTSTTSTSSAANMTTVTETCQVVVTLSNGKVTGEQIGQCS
jgi:hypothetical protein